MKLKKVIFWVGSVSATVVLAAVYGPFRCDNGCDARNPADGMTREYISSTVNAYLQSQAAANKTEHVWRPGDVLKLCDGKWCVELDYHPLTGLFIWKPTKPAWHDQGNKGYDVRVGYTQEEIYLLGSMFKACLSGMFGNNPASTVWAGTDHVTSYYDGDTVVVVGKNATISVPYPDEFCGF